MPSAKMVIRSVAPPRSSAGSATTQEDTERDVDNAIRQDNHGSAAGAQLLATEARRWRHEPGRDEPNETRADERDADNDIAPRSTDDAGNDEECAECQR